MALWGPDLNDAHVEASLLSQLLADVARGLGRRGEGSLQRLQLLGFNGGAWPPPLGAQVLVVILVAAPFLVRYVGALRVLGVVLRRILGVRRQTGVTARGGWGEGRDR